MKFVRDSKNVAVNKSILPTSNLKLKRSFSISLNEDSAEVLVRGDIIVEQFPRFATEFLAQVAPHADPLYVLAIDQAVIDRP